MSHVSLQEKLDDAPTWAQVLKRFEDWLQTQLLSLSPSLPNDLAEAQSLARWTIVSHGKFDMETLVRHECEAHDIPRPVYMRSWIDIGDQFSK
jgi:inhibitor of KinA sporulation pathway (predicted exonuclease)